MNTFIFIGPTISANEAAKHLNASYLPPVKFGDIYRICELYKPCIIGIIDGYFNQVPAVWHKEILWAMNQGCNVYGAASMGALRACELNAYGMIGCGKIFDAYQQGVLLPFVDEVFEDDDEVAVTHAPAELKYQALSEAMVNIRVTLAKAHRAKIIEQSDRSHLIKIAKTLFYPERNYPKILQLALEQGMDEKKVGIINDWINHHNIDQKKLDAIKLLDQIKQAADDKQPKADSKLPLDREPSYIIQHTSQWQSAIDEIDRSQQLQDPALDELRLQGIHFFQALDLALNKVFYNDAEVNQIQTDQITSFYCSPDKLDSALAAKWNKTITQSRLNRLSIYECDQILLSYLKREDKYQPLATRSEDKKNSLAKVKIPLLSELSEIELLQLCDWYFTRNLDTELPNQIERYAAQAGFYDLDSFYDMILKEYYYQQQQL